MVREESDLEFWKPEAVLELIKACSWFLLQTIKILFEETNMLGCR
jgi:hypothetical protein